MTFLSPLDLLTVTGNEQDIIRCLVRRPDLVISEIAKFTKIPLDELEPLLIGMVKNKRLIRNQEGKFQVSLSRSEKPNKGRSGSSLLDSLFGQ